jgi:release factor glutamine methyltransferase
MTETTDQQWTIKRLLDWTTDFFKKTEWGNSRLEAEMLLAEALGCSRIELYTRFDQIPPDEPLAQFREWVKRRGAGEPVAYIVGHKEFYSLKFEVNPDVLIPRPETEHLVVAALETAKSIAENPLRIIDVGTGSGCIAITLAKYLPQAKIAAIDLSPSALEMARRNSETHQVTDQIRFFCGDLFSALPSGSGPVHLIVSNPPYIGTDEQGTVDRQVSDFEPAAALFSGADGLEVTRRLIAEAPDRLLPGGWLIFESSPLVMDRVLQLVEAGSLGLVKVIKDIAGHRRVVVAQRLG